MTPLVVENKPPVTFLRRKMTGGRFSMGVVIRRYTGMAATSSSEVYITDMLNVMPLLRRVILVTPEMENMCSILTSSYIGIKFCTVVIHILTLSLPTSPIGDVIADCQRRRSATWTPSPNLV